MAPPASASAWPLSLPLTVPLSRYHSHVLPATCYRVFPRRRVALAPARPGAALLSSLSDAREDEEEEEEGDFYEEHEQQEYDGEEEEQGYDAENEELVEVGYVSSAHGMCGDVLVLVTPRTDFPELRLATVTPTSIGCGLWPLQSQWQCD